MQLGHREPSVDVVFGVLHVHGATKHLPRSDSKPVTLLVFEIANPVTLAFDGVGYRCEGRQTTNPLHTVDKLQTLSSYTHTSRPRAMRDRAVRSQLERTAT